MGSGPGRASRSSEVNVNRFADSQKQSAGIVHPPRCIRDREVECCRPGPRRHLDFGGDSQFMVGPVYGENAVYAHFSLFLGSHVPIDAIRTKDNVRVAVAL